jgi:hypothetical protein
MTSSRFADFSKTRQYAESREADLPVDTNNDIDDEMIAVTEMRIRLPVRRSLLQNTLGKSPDLNVAGHAEPKRRKRNVSFMGTEASATDTTLLLSRSGRLICTGSYTLCMPLRDSVRMKPGEERTNY